MCVSPYIVTLKDGTLVPVPCGKCVQCLKDYQNDWSFRLKQECKRVPCPIHVTLTYAPECVPVAYNNDACEWQSYLDKRDIQLFLKRLRKYCPEFRNNLRYFAAGEYGSNYNRCHMHIILMSPSIQWTHQYYRQIFRAWNNDRFRGFIKIKRAQNKQINYLTTYLNKLDKSSHITPPFKLMSKGLGLCFLTERMVKYFFETFPTGVRNDYGWQKMPRYYRKKLDEMSINHPMLSRAGLTFSDVVRFRSFEPKGIQTYFDYFCKNYDEVFKKVYRNELRLARNGGYCMPESFTVNDIFEKFCATIPDIMIARYHSDNKIKAIQVKHKFTRLTQKDLAKVNISPP